MAKRKKDLTKPDCPLNNQVNRSKDAADPSAGSGQTLRQKAEALAQERASRTPEDIAALSPEEIQKVLHELRQSEQQSRFLVQNLQAGVVVHAPDTQIIHANEYAATLLGLTLDQMKGKTAIDPAWRFVREDETTMPLEEYPVQRALTTRQPVRDLVVGIDRPATKDRVWAMVNAIPELDADGRLRQVVVTFVDITERRRVEQELQETKNFLQQIVDTSPSMIFVKDGQGRALFVNQYTANIMGPHLSSLR